MKKLFFTSALLITALFFNSCSSDDDGASVTPTPTPTPTPVSNTIVDFVLANDDYSSLGAALEAANLVDVLNGTTEYTVFAPNNASFAAFLTANGFASLDAVPVDVLTQVLLNHVITGNVLSTGLSTGYVNTNATFEDTSNNLNMYINTADGVLINGSTGVTTADITVDNGVIHAVDAVIGLPTVVTFATADSNFETLVAALTREDDFPFVDLLSQANDGTTSAPFTVFAPTNDAFGKLLTFLGVSGLADIPTDTLALTLSTHVVGGANVLSTDLVDGMTVTTLGDTFDINTMPSATFTDQNDRMGNITVTDVQAANGVIHVVDEVILPNLN
tara:strand:- start:636 stop:1631 length:996 start_codon:yes stop_codon:yes gene_type:complete